MRVASFRGPFWRYVVNFIHSSGRPNRDLPGIPFWRWKSAVAAAETLANSEAMEGAIIEIYARDGWKKALEDRPRDRFYGRKIRALRARDLLVEQHGLACPNRYCTHPHCAQIRELRKIIDG